jgi:hypothetical protein
MPARLIIFSQFAKKSRPLKNGLTHNNQAIKAKRDNATATFVETYSGLFFRLNLFIIAL